MAEADWDTPAKKNQSKIMMQTNKINFKSKKVKNGTQSAKKIY